MPRFAYKYADLMGVVCRKGYFAYIYKVFVERFAGGIKNIYISATPIVAEIMWNFRKWRYEGFFRSSGAILLKHFLKQQPLLAHLYARKTHRDLM